MSADAYSVFVNMYLALDAAWKAYEVEDDALRGYLSEADPYMFLDKGSADPAIWSEFLKRFEAVFPGGGAGLEEAHAFAVGYLENLSDEYIEVYGGKRLLVDVFLEFAPLDIWLDVFELQKRRKGIKR